MTANAIRAALKARKAAQSTGPRSLTDLAHAIGYALPSLHQAIAGRRHMPADMLAGILRELPELQPMACPSSDGSAPSASDSQASPASDERCPTAVE